LKNFSLDVAVEDSHLDARSAARCGDGRELVDHRHNSFLVVEAIGLLLGVFGNCTTGLLMSLLDGIVRPNWVSGVYSATLMLGIIMGRMTRFVFIVLLVEGLEL
jgi:hypothetical protein